MDFAKKIKKLSFPIILIIGLFSLLVMLTACGEGEDSSASSETGDIVIGLTDAQGDFVTYTVAATSLSLTKANGAMVETLPVSTTVDFAQYTDMTEFLTAATIPAGSYVTGTLTLPITDPVTVELDFGK